MSAGLAFALQQVVMPLAGYFVVLRGSTFTVRDRISMGGVRGDVLRLGSILARSGDVRRHPRSRPREEVRRHGGALDGSHGGALPDGILCSAPPRQVNPDIGSVSPD